PEAGRRARRFSRSAGVNPAQTAPTARRSPAPKPLPPRKAFNRGPKDESNRKLAAGCHTASRRVLCAERPQRAVTQHPEGCCVRIVHSAPSHSTLARCCVAPNSDLDPSGDPRDGGSAVAALLVEQ